MQWATPGVRCGLPHLQGYTLQIVVKYKRIFHRLSRRLLASAYRTQGRIATRHFALGESRQGFVVVSMPRTGSNLLCSVLDSVPGLTCFYEVYHPDAVYVGFRHKEKLNLGSVKERDRHPYRFLRRVFDSVIGDLVGFKIFPWHHEGVLEFCLSAPSIKKVLLTRHDLLHAYTSLLVAKRSEAFTKRAEERLGEQGVHIDRWVKVSPWRFTRYERRRSKFLSRVRHVLHSTGQDFFELDYRDLTAPGGKLNELVAWLGIDYTGPFEQTTLRQNPPNLRERIVNYEELRAALESGPLERYLR